jgi:hypothetical protein
MRDNGLHDGAFTLVCAAHRGFEPAVPPATVVGENAEARRPR